jgi:foldase protein PrsA
VKRLLTALACVAALAVSGCGGSDADVPPDAVAVVGEHVVKKTELDALMEQAEANYKAQGRDFPAAGSPEYIALRTQAIDLEITEAIYEEKAKDFGIEITEKQVDDKLASLKQQFFGGDEKKLQKQLKQQKMTMEELRAKLRQQLIAERIADEVAKDIRVTDEEIHEYYVAHPDEYKVEESRDVRHILVKKKALADRLRAQLVNGTDADWKRLAKKHSEDPGSKETGGKYTVIRGQGTAKPFETTAFKLKTREVSEPVKTTFGYHVIQALGPPKPAGRTPEKQVKESIRSTLVQQKRNDVIAKWVREAREDFADDIRYQVGYAPPQAPEDAGT